MTTEPYTPADRALEICGAMVTCPSRIGAPLLVRDGRQPVLYPPVALRPGTPLVALIVQSDGVLAVSERHRMYGVLAEPRRFPFPEGSDLTGWPGAVWREALDVWVTAALAALPAAGCALAGP